MTDNFVRDQLRDSEELLAIVRRSPLEHVFGFVFSLLVIIASFFFLYPLLQLGRWGLLIILLGLCGGVFFLVRTFMLHKMNILVLTSERVLDIDQQGLFSRVVSECLYENIQEMSIRITGILGTSFGVGTLMIHTKGDRADLQVTGIKHPQKVQDAITNIQKKIGQSKEGKHLTAEELILLLEKIKSHIDIPEIASPRQPKKKNVTD